MSSSELTEPEAEEPGASQQAQEFWGAIQEAVAQQVQLQIAPLDEKLAYIVARIQQGDTAVEEPTGAPGVMERQGGGPGFSWEALFEFAGTDHGSKLIQTLLERLVPRVPPSAAGVSFTRRFSPTEAGNFLRMGMRAAQKNDGLDEDGIGQALRDLPGDAVKLARSGFRLARQGVTEDTLGPADIQAIQQGIDLSEATP